MGQYIILKICSSPLGPVYRKINVKIIMPEGVGAKKLLLLKTFAVRHSGAGRPSVRSGKRMVAKGKKRTVIVTTVIGGRIEVLRSH